MRLDVQSPSQTENSRTTRRAAPIPAVVRRALDGLTPGVVGLVGIVLLLHALRFVINGVLAAILEHTFLEWLGEVGRIFFLLCVMAVPMLVIIVAASNLGPPPGWRRYLLLVVTVLFAAFVGIALRRWVKQWVMPDDLTWAQWHEWLPQLWSRYAALGGLLTAVSEFYRHERSSVEAMYRAETDRLNFDREMAEARLQVLQAQIEPHFLFNTLANVRRLYQTDAATGRVMLDNLMQYLAVALPRMRETASTLEREAVLMEAYLNVQKIRMGRRLMFRIDIAPDIAAIEVPPMMLLTLVENAIKHGLNPLPEGGFVAVSAARVGDRLLLQVTDTGRGFQQTSGAGTGLANIRARLAAVHGGAATLTLEENHPRGVCATLALPISSTRA